MSQGDITIAEATNDIKPKTSAPKVYNLPDGQGRMASYYNAMELPEHYTSSHGIPRTNHFIPVGYCCMENVTRRPRGYLGKNPRPGYRGNLNVPAQALKQADKTAIKQRVVMAEPRAPPPSPEHQIISIAEAIAELPEETAAISEPRGTTSVPSQAVLSAEAPSYQPMQTPVHPQPQQHLSEQPAALPCPSCAHHSAQPHPTAALDHALPMSPTSTHTLPYPPAICRRWLIGTCRRGPACRNRHHVLHETDAHLHAIKEAHLATMRLYNSGVAQPATIGAMASQEVKRKRSETVLTAIDTLPPLINWAEEVEESKQESKQTGFVEAHIDGIGKVKIPIPALTEQLRELKLDDERKETLTESTTPADAEDDTHSEPLLDYSIAMPQTPSYVSEPVMRPGTQNTAQPIRHRPLRSPPPFIHPADRFRSTYDPSHLQHLSHLPFYPRRHVPQDFVPRHVLDRPLRQYIAGSLKGRRFLEKREVRGAAGRKKAILAGMKGGDDESKESIPTKAGEKQDDAETGAVSATFSDKEVEVAIKKEEVEADVCQNVVGVSGKVEVTADKAKIIPATLVELAHV